MAADEPAWVRCRALAFLDTQYYDDVKPRRPEVEGQDLGLVATKEPHGVVGILDIEIVCASATIHTVAVHPDHRGAGTATALLESALAILTERGIESLDAWTREDAASNAWYRQNGFSETNQYLHVYLEKGEDASGFQCPENLSPLLAAFLHARIEDEAQLRSRFRRVYVCRQYVRELPGHRRDPVRSSR